MKVLTKKKQLNCLSNKNRTLLFVSRCVSKNCKPHSNVSWYHVYWFDWLWWGSQFLSSSWFRWNVPYINVPQNIRFFLKKGFWKKNSCCMDIMPDFRCMLCFKKIAWIRRCNMQKVHVLWHSKRSLVMELICGRAGLHTFTRSKVSL